MKVHRGIDFGTSTTLIAERSGGIPSILPIGEQTTWFPTVASVASANGQLIVGERALEAPPSTLLRSIKSAIGAEVTHVTRQRPDGSRIELEVDAVVAEIFREALTRADRQRKGKRAQPSVRLGCPAIWDGKARRRLRDIAASAGLSIGLEDILDEPIAAGISWIVNRRDHGLPDPDGRVLVFDYGGGTLDVAVLEVDPGSPPEVTVLAASGSSQAGDLLDSRIAEHLLHDLRAGDVDGEDETFRRVLELAAERLKQFLTDRTEAPTRLPAAFGGHELRLSRSELESIFTPQLDVAMSIVEATLRAAELRKRGADTTAVRGIDGDVLRKEVAYVLLSGGLCRVPAVAQRLQQEFPSAEIGTDIRLSHPEESVVSGLTFDEAVSRLNVHRPGFDFVLDAPGHGRTSLYDAYTPLYTSADILSGRGMLGRDKTVSVGNGVTATISCVSPEGRAVPLHVRQENRSTDHVSVEADAHGRVFFKLYVDGRVVIRGKDELWFRVERWPVLRGPNYSPVQLTQLEPSDWRDWRKEQGPGWWHG